MDPVKLVWLVPALPLGALVIIFCITRPLETLLGRSHAHASSAVGGHGGHEPGEPAGAGHGDTGAHSPHAQSEERPSEQTPDQIQATQDEDAHGGHGAGAGAGHGGHGGSTSGMGLLSSIIGVVAMGLSAALSIAILIQLVGNQGMTPPDTHLYNWFTIGGLKYSIDFHVDNLTAIMLVVVTGVSFLVHLYSVGYMAGDQGYARFFLELLLFTVSMLILVLAANFLVLFIGWELVGLSSYLLIGFWFYHAPPPPGSEVPYPPPASLKAFVTTRLGDFGFLIGILILWVNTQTFNFVALNTATRHVNQAVITAAMILIFCGAVGKSAQFPLHVWLPDAMAGPTPVSALIHAATMVAAGVYLVARLFPIYAGVAGPQSLSVVGYIGAGTALFAATIALTQNDIKGVLAYSTISQLGYMFAGLSVAETNAVGIYHLFTHAFFKALLFLGSGSVIHAVANQDMRKMGGLAKFMPITAITFLIATLSISGVPPFSGFWSKDPIIGLAYDHHNYIIYGMTLFTAFLTAFYMFRLYFMTFGGAGGAYLGFWGGRRQYRGEGHPHESPWMMWVPLVVLAAVTVIIGLAGFAGLNEGFAKFLNGGNAVTYHPGPALDTLTIIGVAVAILGILVSWSAYGLGSGWVRALVASPIGKPIYTLLYHRYYLDELYTLLIRWVIFGLSNGAALFDRYVIDGVVNGSARAVLGIGKITRRSETGALQNYGAALFGGAMIILLVFFVAVGAIH